jgi:hypothetical protein
MLSPRPDRALRRLVADLSEARSEDVAAVLAQLDPAQRRKVEALLIAYRGGGVAAPVQVVAHAPPAPDPFEGVSPWLAARLSERRPLRLAADTAGPGLEHAMTAPALAALRSVAAEVRPEAAPPLVAPIETQPRKPPRRDRLHDILLGRRGPS